MKPLKGSNIQSVKEYWKRLMHSSKQTKISSGAVNFEKSITHAVRDNWRRKEHAKKSSS